MQLGPDLQWFHDAADSGFTQSGDVVSQWDDLTDAQRHWIQSGSARPAKTIDGQGREIVRFDGVDDVMLMTGTIAAARHAVGLELLQLRARQDPRVGANLIDVDCAPIERVARTLSVEDRQRLLDWTASRWGS